MKTALLVALLLLAALVFARGIRLQIDIQRFSKSSELGVVIVYNPSLIKEQGYIIDAYKSVLEEEGVPISAVSVSILLGSNPKDVAVRKPAIIFPDGANQVVPEGFAPWLKSYIRHGGNAAIIYDVGIRNNRGAYLKEAVFSSLAGVNYITYDRLKDDAYAEGVVRFKDAESSEHFEIPYGKLGEDLTLSGYGFGDLKYRFARTETRGLEEDEVYAYALPEDGGAYPAIVVRRYGNGRVLYVNLPLGYLKAHSDDLPMRAIMRAFLFREVKVPHLVGSPYGRGGLVMNWHIDDNSEWIWAEQMVSDGLLREDLPASIHITAGDFVNTPGDGIGFDACGQGKRIAKLYLKFGVIGSHGGWAHNWFARNIQQGRFGAEEIRRYIEENSRCLESIAGYKIVEYSAPVGVFPQPLNTKILEKMGFVAYYSTGDSGSAPNRAFFDGEMISSRLIEFPVMPFGKCASVWELQALCDRSSEELAEWLYRTADYLVKNRTVRLIYTHPYDIYETYEHKKYDYLGVLRGFFDHLADLQENGKLAVRPMSYFAEFIQRFLKTSYSFELNEDGLVVWLKNKGGLNGIAIAVPKFGYARPKPDATVNIEEDGLYYYVVIKDRVDAKVLRFNSI